MFTDELILKIITVEDEPVLCACMNQVCGGESSRGFAGYGRPTLCPLLKVFQLLRPLRNEFVAPVSWRLHRCKIAAVTECNIPQAGTLEGHLQHLVCPWLAIPGHV